MSCTASKIKEAARTTFLKKGFAGTRTRDIAELSGENLALINYYFRSKENLFQAVIKDIMAEFMNSMIPVFMDPDTSLQEKIQKFVENHINLLTEQPEIQLFILNELQEGGICNLQDDLQVELITHSIFYQQLSEQIKDKSIDPIHLLMNIVSMTVFPFISKSLFSNSPILKEKNFDELMEERKKLIPIWVDTLIKG